MSAIPVKVILQDIKKIEAEALIVGFYEDVRPLKGVAGELDWLLCGALSSLILKQKVHGSFGDAALLTSRGKVPAKKIFLVGLGPQGDFSPASLRRAAASAISRALDAGVRSAAIEYFHRSDTSYESGVTALRQGISDGVAGRGIDIMLLAPDAAAYEQIARFVKN